MSLVTWSGQMPVRLREVACHYFSETPLSALGRLGYRVALKSALPLLASVEGVAAVYLRGSFLGQWVPVASDIDLQITRRSFSSPEEETDFLLRLRKRWRALARAFPVLGELGVVEDSTWNLYREIAPERRRGGEAILILAESFGADRQVGSIDHAIIIKI